MDLDLLALFARYSYPAIFGLLVAAGVGLPVSEELILLSAGMMAAHGKMSVPLLAGVSWLGVCLGDALLFRMGRSIGKKASSPRLPFRWRAERAASFFQRWGAWAVLMVRFLPGLRAPTYVMAGMMQMPVGRFLWVDALAAMVSTPLLLWVGFEYGLWALEVIRRHSPLVVMAVVVLLGGMFLFRWRKKALVRKPQD